MIDQMALVFYLLLFVLALYLAGYNLFYLKGIESTTKYVGFCLPKTIKQAVRINLLLSVVTLCVIGVIALAR